MLFVPARIRSRARQKGWGPFSNWYKSRGGGSLCPPPTAAPLGRRMITRTGAGRCRLMHGSYKQGEGTNGGRLRVFSSDQAPWRVLLQALDLKTDHQILESGIWDSIVRYKSERGVLDKSKISREGSFFQSFLNSGTKGPPNGENEARTPSATAPNLPGLGIEPIHPSRHPPIPPTTHPPILQPTFNPSVCPGDDS